MPGAVSSSIMTMAPIASRVTKAEHRRRQQHGTHMNAIPRAGFSVAGTVLAIAAILIGIFHFYLGPIAGPATLEETAYETAKSLREAVVAGWRGEEYEAPQADSRFDPDTVVKLSVVAAGGLAILLGLAGILRREHFKLGGAAITLGTTAILVEVAILAAALVGAVILLLIIADVLGLDLAG
jgi:hypothetical protein